MANYYNLLFNKPEYLRKENFLNNLIKIVALSFLTLSTSQGGDQDIFSQEELTKIFASPQPPTYLFSDISPQVVGEIEKLGGRVGREQITFNIESVTLHTESIFQLRTPSPYSGSLPNDDPQDLSVFFSSSMAVSPTSELPPELGKAPSILVTPPPFSLSQGVKKQGKCKKQGKSKSRIPHSGCKRECSANEKRSPPQSAYTRHWTLSALCKEAQQGYIIEVWPPAPNSSSTQIRYQLEKKQN